MMTHRVGRKLLWAAALLLLASPRLVRAEDESVPTDRLLPPNVSFYLTVPDWEQLKTRWNESLMGRLREEPKMAEFFKDLEGQWKKWSEKTKEKVGLPLEDILSIPGGEVSLAVVTLPGKGPAFIALLDYGEKQEEVEKLLEKAEEALEEAGAKKRESSKNDTTIITYVMAKKGDDDDFPARKPKDNNVSYFQKDSWLVISSETAALEAVLTRWDGKHKQTFADNDVYQYILERVQPKDDTDAALVWYINPLELIRTGVQSAGQGNLQAQMALGFLPALGLDKFKAVGGSYDLSTEEFDGVSRTLLYVDQPPEGLLNVFQFPAIDQAPPKWVPSTASTWYGINWDVAEAYASVEKLVDGFQGAGTFSNLIDDLAKKEGGPKLHLKRDFFDLLSGRMDVYSAPPAEAAGEAEEVQLNRTLMSFSLKDTDKMKGTLTKLAATPGFPGMKRDFEGATIFEIRNPVPAAAGGSFGITAADNKLMVSSDVTLLEQVLRNDKDQKPLSDDPEYQQIARKMPTKSSIAGFQRQDAQVKALYDMLKAGQAPIPGTDDIDFTKLPDFSVIQKYLPATGSYAEPDKNGALMVSFTLKEKFGSK